MKMQIGEIAKKSGVTVRTLQYYDSIGLLKPAEVSDSGFLLCEILYVNIPYIDRSITYGAHRLYSYRNYYDKYDYRASYKYSEKLTQIRKIIGAFSRDLIEEKFYQNA